MKVLIACEFSGVVREAFRKRGHDAWSCDILPTEQPGQHIQGDVLGVLDQGWDLMIAHPPCTHLCSSGARWFKEKQQDGRQQAAKGFFIALADSKIPKVAVENPVGIMSTVYRKPDQIIQPHQYGHAETKATCLWLKELPLLVQTDAVEPDYMRKPDGSYYTDAKGKRYSRIHFLSRSHPDRAKIRSLTYPGIAAAMAAQWG